VIASARRSIKQKLKSRKSHGELEKLRLSAHGNEIRLNTDEAEMKKLEESIKEMTDAYEKKKHEVSVKRNKFGGIKEQIAGLNRSHQCNEAEVRRLQKEKQDLDDGLVAAVRHDALLELNSAASAAAAALFKYVVLTKTSGASF